VIMSGDGKYHLIEKLEEEETFEGSVFQIPKRSPYRSHANKRIDVHVLLVGRAGGKANDEKQREDRLNFRR
jgi:hypothetical protein